MNARAKKTVEFFDLSALCGYLNTVGIPANSDDTSITIGVIRVAPVLSAPGRCRIQDFLALYISSMVEFMADAEELSVVYDGLDDIIQKELSKFSPKSDDE